MEELYFFYARRVSGRLFSRLIAFLSQAGCPVPPPGAAGRAKDARPDGRGARSAAP